MSLLEGILVPGAYDNLTCLCECTSPQCQSAVARPSPLAAHLAGVYFAIKTGDLTSPRLAMLHALLQRRNALMGAAKHGRTAVVKQLLQSGSHRTQQTSQDMQV